MNYLWSGMILTGIVFGTLTGNLEEVTKAVISSSREAVELCVAVAGVIAMWTGMMKIAETTGLVKKLAGKMGPLIRFLFPRISPESETARYLSLNFLSNVLGLGWAATPAGLRAMEGLAKLEEERRQTGSRCFPSGTSSNEMCTFLIINISSLQLIPVNMIAYRAQYGSADPAAVVGPGIAATLISTVVAVVFCRGMDRKRNQK